MYFSFSVLIPKYLNYFSDIILTGKDVPFYLLLRFRIIFSGLYSSFSAYFWLNQFPGIKYTCPSIDLCIIVSKINWILRKQYQIKKCCFILIIMAIFLYPNGWKMITWIFLGNFSNEWIILKIWSNGPET